MTQKRNRTERSGKAEEPVASSDGASSNPMERFKSLARRIVRIPKEESDAAEREYRKDKEAKRRPLILLENETDVPFITGDQPVINLLSPGTGEPPKLLAFYYPVSPQLAVILDEASERTGYAARPVSAHHVIALNRRIQAAAHAQVFGSSRDVLNSLSQGVLGLAREGLALRPNLKFKLTHYPLERPLAPADRRLVRNPFDPFASAVNPDSIPQADAALDSRSVALRARRE